MQSHHSDKSRPGDNSDTSTADPHDYFALTPDVVISATESLGYLSDARIFPLNSYENRVYQVGIEEAQPLIAKFYRPARWTDAQILEEHHYSQHLLDLELPVVAPLQRDGKTLHHYEGYRFALYPRVGGQAPEPDDFDQLYRLGRLIGRMHAVGREHPFTERLCLSVDNYCTQPSQLLLEQRFIPAHLESRFTDLQHAIGEHALQQLDKIPQQEFLRTHGDCHIGNILWNRDTGPWFVDFDDCITAPAVQDLWMLLAGTRNNQQQQLSEVIEGYEEFCDFNRAELSLIESLRGLRMIHYAGWLAKRWDDPAFPKHFPWFNTENYWEMFMNELEQQRLVMNEPPLTLY